MSVLIVGSKGSMGRRYEAILKDLGVQCFGIDKDFTKRDIVRAAGNFSKIILCTPTPTHYVLLKDLIPLGKPILCEKPITTNLDELTEILDLAQKHETYFTMVMQYSEIVNKNFIRGESKYDYFRTGNDGLVWDCLQIVALSKSPPSLGNTSPVWTCLINGQKLNLSDMDQAYVSFVSKWLKNEINQEKQYLYDIHEKVSIENERYIKLQTQRN